MSRRHSLVDVLRSTVRYVPELVWPRTCSSCRERGAWVCAHCLAAIPLAHEPWCLRCGSGTCTCSSLPSGIAVARSVGPHDGWLAAAVHRLKYEGESARARHLGEAMAPLLAGVMADEPTAIIVPVPLHPRRERQRGYNQSLLVAHAAAGPWRGSLTPAALRRVRPTAQQVGLSPIERAGNVAGAFAADIDLVAGRPIVLIDDVLTTGSTVAACAMVLHDAGAAAVAVVTLTRANWNARAWAEQWGSAATRDPGPGLSPRPGIRDPDRLD